MKDLRAWRNAARSVAAAAAVLASERGRLAKVSGSQGGKVRRREHVGPGSGPRLKVDVAGLAAARQVLL